MSDKQRQINSNIVGVFLGLSTWRFSLPFGILAPLPIGHVFMILVVVRYFVRKFTLKEALAPRKRTVGKLVLLYAAMLAFVIVINPPGVNGAGGYSEALYYVLFALAFFAFRSLLESGLDIGKVLKISIFLAILGLMIQLSTGLLSGDVYDGLWYHYYSWLIAAILLSVFVGKYYGSNSYKIVLLFIAFAVMAALTPHRDRPFLALFNFAIILYGFQRTKILSRLLIASFLFIVVTASLGINYQPLASRRSLSPVFTILGIHDSAQQPGGGALGFNDPVRGVLYNYAFQHIVKHPVVGEGFAIPRSLISEFKNINEFNATPEVIYSLSVAGAYHDGFLELAVKGGLPIAIILLLIVSIQSAQFVQWTRRLSLTGIKVLSAALSGYFIQVLGQVLINGGGNEIALTGGLLGLMSGLMAYAWIRDESDLSRTF